MLRRGYQNLRDDTQAKLVVRARSNSQKGGLVDLIRKKQRESELFKNYIIAVDT
jgi:hypothetical protein